MNVYICEYLFQIFTDMLMWISEIKIFTDLNVNIRQYIVLDINGYECLYLWISILDIHRYAHVIIWGHYIDRYDVHICEYLWIYLTNICEYNGPMSVQIPGPDINRGFNWREYLFLKFSDIHMSISVNIFKKIWTDINM